MALASRARNCRDVAIGLPLILLLAAPAAGQNVSDNPTIRNVVGVALIRNGQTVLLATPGIEDRRRQWRFRSLDTHDLPQPIRDASLSQSGTKLFLETAAGPVVLDLTRENRHNARLQHVSLRDVAAGGMGQVATHRLPGQQFVSMRDGMLRVIDDLGAVQSERPMPGASVAGIDGSGCVLVVRADRHAEIYPAGPSNQNGCLESPAESDDEAVAVIARPGRNADSALSRFLLLSGPVERTRILDPHRGNSLTMPMRRAEAALRAYLIVNGLPVVDASVGLAVDTLLREAAASSAASGEAVADWRFFHVAPDEELYAPVLQFARRESAYPDVFGTLEMLGGAGSAGAPHEISEVLRDKYLQLSSDERRGRCSIYFRTLSAPGSWVIEYWLYYPFDIGGLGSHLHDPEHLFVEVDKLGGTIRRVIGAGHGYIAGNNVYSADAPGALPVELPLYTIVELGKHATAPDIDGDGIFTPGLDENEYRERAKIWGVRDVIGTINNQLIAYDRTMTALRIPADILAPASIGSRFPTQTALAAKACCRLLPLPAGNPDWPTCNAASSECAERSVTSHPDARDPRTILKEWVFPHAFLRAVYGLGPRERLNTGGLAYVVDMDRMPGLARMMPMPGRVAGEIFWWHQDVNVSDKDSCMDYCEHASGAGAGIRYEQFMSNLFGIYTAVRVYSPPVSDVWITFGPMVELPLMNRSNLNFQAGLAFRPYGSPRFEMKVSLGLWKPKSHRFGMPAGDPR